MLWKLIELCVHKRILTLLIVLAVGVYGVNAYRATPVEAFPDVTDLQVTVLTQLPGLAPEEIERQLTVPLERALNGTPEMTRIRSESHFGLSMVILSFQDGADVFRVRTLVAERMAQADLPEGAEPTLSPNATPLGKVFVYRLVSDHHTPTELRSEQDWTVAPLLKQIPGIADVVSFGGYRKEFHIQIDPAKLQAHGLRLSEATEALERSNRNVGGGILTFGDQGLAIRGVGYAKDPQDLLNVVLKSTDGVPVTVRDIAQLTQSYTPLLGSVGYGDNSNTTEGYILLRRGENPSTVLAQVEEKVSQLNSGLLPDGITIVPFYNRSQLIATTLNTVHKNLLFGALLVVGVVWLFLRSLRCSLIVAAVIPLALLGAFIGLHALELPANLISMGAIDFGILVDAAVVMTEGVVHGLSVRKPRGIAERLQIIIESAREVVRPAAFAMAIITAALLPIFTLERIEGRIFRPLALTYAFALIGSLILAITLVPTLCALLLRPKDVEQEEPRSFTWLRRVQTRVLSFMMLRKWVAGVALALCAGLGAATHTQIGSEFLPELNEGDLLVFAELPASVSLREGAQLIQQIRLNLLEVPEVAEVLSEQGRPEDGTDNEALNLGKIHVRLKPQSEWRHGLSRDELQEALRNSLAEIPGVKCNFSQPIRDAVEESVSGARGQVVLKIFGQDLDVMRETLTNAVGAIEGVAGVIDLDLYRDASVPQLLIELDRPALAQAGVLVNDALEVAETAMGGRVVTAIWEGERPVDVRVRYTGKDRDNVQNIKDILVPDAAGNTHLLQDLSDIRVASGRGSILRENTQRFAALKFNIDGRDMGSVVADAQRAVAEQVTIPEGYHIVWTGEFENQTRAMQRLALVVPISLGLVFGLLYLSLRSLSGSLVTLFIAPFAMTGGLIALWLTDINLSVSAAVGFITLLGQTCLACLLIISAIDAKLQQGVALKTALLEGTGERLRAVLMTTLLALLGLMPMAISTAIGSETQRPFAVAIIGGLVTAIPITLWILPPLYGGILTLKSRLIRPPSSPETAL